MPLDSQRGDITSVTYSGNAVNAVDANNTGNPNYSINVSAAGESAHALLDYNVVYVDGTLTINQRSIEIMANDQSKTYDGIAFMSGTPSSNVMVTPLSMTNQGLASNDTLSSLGLTLGGTAQGQTDAATYSGQIVITGATNPNYSYTFDPGTLQILTRPITITAINQTKTYNAQPFSSGPALVGSNIAITGDGFAPGQSLSDVTALTLGGPAQGKVNVGSYGINPVAGVTSNPNYDITYVNGNLTVNPAPLTITADSETKLFGSSLTLTGSEFTVQGLQGGDTLTSVGLTSLGAPASADPGGYSIDFTSYLSGSGLSNYSIRFIPGTLLVEGTIVGRPSVPGSLKYSFDELNAATYDEGIYGERRYYLLEVPGKIDRILPRNLSGLETGSSRVHTTIGMDTLFDLDRFQVYKH